MWLWIKKIFSCNFCVCHFKSKCCDIEYDKEEQNKEVEIEIENSKCCYFTFKKKSNNDKKD